MLRQRASVLRKANIITDAGLLVAAFLVAFNLRVQLGGLGDLDTYTWVLFAAVPVWLFLLERYGFYDSQRMSSPWAIFKALGKVTALGGVITASLIFCFEPKGFSRSFYGSFLILSFLMLLSEQLLVRFGLRFLRLEGYNYRNILLVGTGESAARILDILDRNKAWGLKVVGLLHTKNQHDLAPLNGHPVIGSLHDMEDICKANTVDEVIFCDSKEESRFEIAGYIAKLDEMGITARTVLNLFFRFEGKKEIGMLHDEVPMMTFRSVSVDADQLFYKRCLDIVGSCVGLGFSACLFPFIAVAVKLESPGPLFFGQTRVRENGRTFTCWKFRSMYQDAEQRKQELMHLNEMEGAIFKMKNDPRVTKVGAFLRKTSLDELPQFWNVLMGEMSLVGTRPPTPAEVKSYQNWQRKRICMKPGLTGLWQVSGRNSITDFDEVVRLDLEYIDTWSLATDLRLILRTLKVVFFREGAC
jgi:exopolysaccharide biosynthesis polyprenyl glycosylphosphotransferase